MKKNKTEARQVLVIVYIVVLVCALFIGLVPATRLSQHHPTTLMEKRIVKRVENINDETLAEAQEIYSSLERQQRAVVEQIKKGNTRLVWHQVAEINIAFFRLFEIYPEYFPYLRTEAQQLWTTMVLNGILCTKGVSSTKHRRINMFVDNGTDELIVNELAKSIPAEDLEKVLNRSKSTNDGGDGGSDSKGDSKAITPESASERL